MLEPKLFFKELRRVATIKDLEKCGYDKALHEVHQQFGSDHPVTKAMFKMRKELAEYRKKLDKDERKARGVIWKEQNELRAARLAEKCL